MLDLSLLEQFIFKTKKKYFHSKYPKHNTKHITYTTKHTPNTHYITNIF